MTIVWIINVVTPCIEYLVFRETRRLAVSSSEDGLDPVRFNFGKLTSASQEVQYTQLQDRP